MADVYKETFEGTTNVIMRLERNMDDQIQALNQVSIKYFFNLVIISLT